MALTVLRPRLVFVKSLHLPPSCRRQYTHGIASESPFKVLFMGRDEFSCLVLKELHSAQDVWDQLVIATLPDQRVGRRGSQLSISPLKIFGESIGLPVHTIPHTKADFCHWKASPPSPFSDEHPSPPSNHLVVTASFGRILPSPLLDLFQSQRRLNVHPSLLPIYRGPAPIQHTIMNGDAETGVCIIQMLKREEGIDAGGVYGSFKLVRPPDLLKNVLNALQAIQEDTDFATLRNELGIEGGKLLVSVLRDMIAGRASLADQPSSHSASHAHIITSRDSVIDFESMTAEVIVRRHRAFSHQVSLPLVAHLETGKSIQLHDLAVHPLFASEYLLFAPGAARYDEQAGSLLIRCADDTVLSVSRVKQEGKALVNAKDWWNGVKGLGLVDVDQIQLVGSSE
ncbi:Formyl transferase [Amanita muscaria]